MPKYYPIMLDIRERPVVVIGGNRVAAEKAAALSASGAHVTAVSEEFCEELIMLSRQHKITLRYKTYEPVDLEGAFVVVAVAEDPDFAEAIWTETQRRGQLVNIVDVPARCNFIIPSILRRDQLTIAVSTEGASPSLAKRIRQRLEGLFPPAYGAYLRLAAVVRARMRQASLSYAQRDDFFGDFYESDVLQQLAENNESAALSTTVTLLHQHGLDLRFEDISLMNVDDRKRSIM